MSIRPHHPITLRVGPRAVVALVVAIGLLSAARAPAGIGASGSGTTTEGRGAPTQLASESLPLVVTPHDTATPTPAAPAGLLQGQPFAGAEVPAVRGARQMPVPGIVRFRPRDGSSQVSPSANLSVRFTTAMDQATTERAFSAALPDGTAIVGASRWAEGDTVLVLDPNTTLPRGARVILAVATGALSADGVSLAAATSVTFTVAAPAAPAPKRATVTPTSTGWRWPLLGPITQYFGQSLTAYGFHQGIDIDGNTGDPVRAAHAGRVVVAGHYDDCGGLEIHIDHGNGVASWYRHLSRIDVAVGSTVDVGSVIGLMGATGCALGSHLHFAVRIGSTFVDPLRYLPQR